MANVDVEKTPSQILRDAAGVIRERGWCQGDYENDLGHVCVYGALNLAEGRRPDSAARGPFYRPIVDALREVNGDIPLSTWNDAPERTKEQIFAALESAAASLESA